jgi:hypothetical protein
MANHLHIQRDVTRFEPGHDTEYRDPDSSFIIPVSIFCLMPATSWRRRLESSSSEWTRYPNSSYLFALPAFIITFCSITLVNFQLDAQNSYLYIYIYIYIYISSCDCPVHRLTGAQDSHLQRVTIPEDAYIFVQLLRRPPEDEQGNARNM